MSSAIKLNELPPFAEAQICTLEHGIAIASRLTDLGFYPGAQVKRLFSAVFGDPDAYMIQNAVIALRRSEAEKILVLPL